MRVLCILNEKSGPSPGPTPQQIISLFELRGISAVVTTLGDDIDLEAEVKSALDKKIEIVVACGGDGTVNAIASALVAAGSGMLGILPLGTLNHLAKDLNIPLTLSEAVDVICQAHEGAIDVAQVNEVHFVNNSSLGIYPAMVKLRERVQRQGHRKWWAAFVASLRALKTFRRVNIEIKLRDGNAIRRRTSLLFVGNNTYQISGTKIGTRDTINQGVLWVGVSTSQTRWGLVKSALALVLRNESKADMVHFEATSLQVQSHKRLLAVAVDGEVLKLSTPLQYTIMPASLVVLVPGNVPEK